MGNYLEISGFIAAILSVWLTIQKNKWCWFWNALSAFLYAIYFSQIQLIADSFLQYFFIIVSIYGFYSWNKEISVNEFDIKYLSKNNRILIAIIVFLFAGLMGRILDLYSFASIPYVDCFCFALSFFATILAIKKYIDNWIIWIFTNAIYIAMYIYKGAYLTAFLYFLFFVLAIQGLNTWKKQLKTK